MKNSKFKLVLMLLIGAVVSAASVDQAREDYYKGVEKKQLTVKKLLEMFNQKDAQLSDKDLC